MSMRSLNPYRILIVDDHVMVREGLRLRISAFPDLEVCGEASSEDEAMDLIKQESPQLVIVDISLKQGHGIELLKRAKAVSVHDREVAMDCVAWAQDCLRLSLAARTRRARVNCFRSDL